jgi:hypothetical protein
MHRRKEMVAMTPESIRYLQEVFLKEPWHEVIVNWEALPYAQCACGLKNKEALNHLRDNPNRTFKADSDFFAVFDKLHELGEWIEFYHFTWQRWYEIPNQESIKFHPWAHTQWLLSKTDSGHWRLCELAVEYLKQKGEGK